jgi:Penicillinase repressor
MTVPPPLHELEAEVMDEVWHQGETSVKLVMEALNGRTRRARAYTTYMTLMRRLDTRACWAERAVAGTTPTSLASRGPSTSSSGLKRRSGA